MAKIPDGTVMMVAFNMEHQIAVDDQDNIWTVDGWRDADGDELAMDDPNSEDSNWALVEYVTAWSDHRGDRVWTFFRPDDFDRGIEG